MAYLLALIVGLGSFGLYMTAFFFPEVHRKFDFIWSGIGMFYALVLWVCAGQITGGVLLGQIASVALLGWFVWQAINLRRELVPEALRTLADQPEQTMGRIILENWKRSQTYLHQNVQRILAGVTERRQQQQNSNVAVSHQSHQTNQSHQKNNTSKPQQVLSSRSAKSGTRAQPASSLANTSDAQTVLPGAAATVAKTTDTSFKDAIAQQDEIDPIIDPEVLLEPPMKQPVPIPLSDIRPAPAQPRPEDVTESTQPGQRFSQHSDVRSPKTSWSRSPHPVSTLTQRVWQVFTGSPPAETVPTPVRSAKNSSRTSQQRPSVQRAVIEAELVADEEIQAGDLVKLQAELESSGSTRAATRRTRSSRAAVEIPETEVIEVIEVITELPQPEIEIHPSTDPATLDPLTEDSEDWF